MALVFDQFFVSGPNESPDQNAQLKTPLTVDAPLQAVLAKKDDRLLRDIGLTREDVRGAEGLVRDELARNRLFWNL